jgi:hypothetical protein
MNARDIIFTTLLVIFCVLCFIGLKNSPDRIKDSSKDQK